MSRCEQTTKEEPLRGDKTTLLRAMSDFSSHANEYVKALARAIQAMHPRRDVYKDALWLIAHFAGPYRELPLALFLAVI